MAEPISAGELIALLEQKRARLGEGAVIAFDGDGTLWRGDIGEALFESLVASSGVNQAAAAALAAEARAAGLPADGADPNQLARALLSAHREGRYDEGRAFAMMAWAFAGWRSEELRAFCEQVLDDFGFEAALRPSLGRVRQWAAGAAVPAYIVSASPEAVVVAAAARMNVDRACVIAMRAAEESGVILPRLAAEPTYGPGKVQRLLDRIGTAPLLAAFGDSGWDAHMLGRAAVACAVCPAPSLRARLHEIAGARVLEEG